MCHGLHNWERLHEICHFALSRNFGYKIYASFMPPLCLIYATFGSFFPHFFYLCSPCSLQERALAVIVPWGDRHRRCLATASYEDALGLDLT